jgi:hypothetical protein
MDLDSFKLKLIDELSEFLKLCAEQFRGEEMKAFDVGCFPWYESFEFSFLSAKEFSKGGNDIFLDIADWDHYCFFIEDPKFDDGLMFGEINSWMHDQYENNRDDFDVSALYDAVAEAARSNKVKEALKNYTITPDFSVLVSYPDDPNHVNLCERFPDSESFYRVLRPEIWCNPKAGLRAPLAVKKIKHFHECVSAEDNDDLANYINVEHLQLTRNNLTELPSCVSNFVKCIELDLSENNLTSLTGIENLADSLTNLRITGLPSLQMSESISKLVKLRKLVVLDCGLDLVPECFRNLKKLEELSLPGNNIVTLPSWLNDLPMLRKISLGRKLDDTEKNNYSISHPNIEIV